MEEPSDFFNGCGIVAILFLLFIFLIGCSHVHEWEEYEIQSEEYITFDIGYRQSGIIWWWE